MKTILTLRWVAMLLLLAYTQHTSAQNPSCAGFGASLSNATLTCAHPKVALSATATGGTAPYTYQWASATTTAQDSVTTAGIYTVTITDTNNCTATASVAVTQNTIPPVVGIAGNTVLCSGNNTATLTASGGDTYNWNTLQTTPSTTIAQAGVYTVTATNSANGCTSSASIAVTTYANPTMPILQGNTMLCSGYTSTICADSGFAAYAWSTGDNTQCSVVAAGGIYTLIVTNVNGCSASATISIAVLPTPVANITSSGFCVGDLGTLCTPSFGQYSYIWGGAGVFGATTSCITITNSGVYYVTVMDFNGCTAESSITVVATPTPPMPTVTPANPSLNCTGSVVLTASGGSSGIYEWFDMPNFGQMIAVGSVFVTPVLFANTSFFVRNISSNGCASASTAVNITVGGGNCAAIISGYALRDIVPNCARDANDAGIPYTNLRLTNTQTNAISYFSTDLNGFYQTTADTGTYTLSLVNPINHCDDTLVCPVTNQLNINANSLFGTYDNNNFYYHHSGLPQTDLSCSMYAETARPVFPRTFVLHYYNHSNIAVSNLNLSFTKATEWTNLMMQIGSPLYNTQTGNTYTWNIATMPPNSHAYIHFTMELPNTITLGMSLTNTLTISNSSALDCNTTNNVAIYNQIVTNSYDPNDKTLLNTQNEMGGMLNDGADLNYQIRFQNTGTDTAYTVIVRDTIDATRMDWTTLKITAASHNVALRWESPNIAVFDFGRINLVDSLHNEPASHGYLQYSVTPLANTPMFATTDNTANIFFDFNAPVRTNTVHTTFVPHLSTNSIAAFAPSIVLQPNPVANILTIKTDIAGAYTLTLQDALGRVLQTQTITQANTELSLAHLPQGTYFIQIKTATGQVVRKVVKI